MQRWIDLTEAEETALQGMARTVGVSEGDLLKALTDVLLAGRVAPEPAGVPDLVLNVEGRQLFFEANASGPIRSSPRVLGGDARVRDTRIPVWLLVAHKRWGESDSDILAQYPGLNAVDLAAAWDYYATNSERVDAERRANEEAS